MKRILKIILMVFAISGLAVSLLACGSASESRAVTEDKVVAVQRGDLTIDITAVGNLAFSRQEELAFEVGGTVAEVLVEVGDSVAAGQTLVGLDISEWAEQLDALQQSVTLAESGLTAAERSVISAERMLATRESSLLQAKINLMNAQLALDNALSAGWTSDKENEIEMKELQVELAGMHLVEAQNAVLDAQQAIADAQQAVADAQQEIVDAQQELAEAETTSLVIKAPFDGLVTAVSVSVDDSVQGGHVAAVLADPTEFEAEILVNEIDIFNVRLGAQASIQVDALAGISLPAKVIYVSPTAVIQAGVVNYRVKVELESLMPTESLIPTDEQEQVPVMPGGIDEVLDKAVKEGRLSPEQADIMKERFGQMAEGFSKEQIEQLIERFAQGGGGFSRGDGGFGLGDGLSEEQREQFQERFGLGQGAGGTRLPPGMVRGVIQLREGLSITVSIIIEERNDVLLVPNSAITYQGGTAYVKVSENGVIEERAIQTGISNWQYTEVMDGLREGEQIVVPQGTTTTTTSQQQPGRPGGFGIPGMGGFGR